MKDDYKYKGLAEKIKEILQENFPKKIKVLQILNRLCLTTTISSLN